MKFTKTLRSLSILVFCVLGACGASTTHASTTSTPSPKANLATISGSLHIIGGPAPGNQDHQVDGTITAIDAAGRRWHTTTPAHGIYTLAVPPGTYDVFATTNYINNGHDDCRSPGRVIAVPHRTAEIVVRCIVP
jgi:hypothetical protein